MAYFLGYRKNGEFQPIIIDNKYDILSLVNFTCSFENEEKLIDYLLEEGLIQDYDVELSYLIDKGKKDNKVYTPLPNINRIFYFDNSNSFDINKLKFYIKNNINDTTLVKYLLSNLLKKYGIDKHIRVFIENNIMSQSKRKYLILTLESILANSYIKPLNNNIQRLITAIQSNDDFLNLSINSFIDFIQNNNESIVYLYSSLNRHLKMPKILEIDDLFSLNYLIENYYLNESEISIKVDIFIDHYIFKGETINSRNLVDLGSIIQDYKDYVLNLKIQRFDKNLKKELEYDEIDEFLEEDDFALYHTTSENSGVRIHPTDSTTWRKK